MHRTCTVILFLVLISSGCIVEAWTSTTYRAPYNEKNTLVLNGDGSFEWHQTNYDRKGTWYEEGGCIYLDIGSFLGDVKLETNETGIFWPNGTFWEEV